MNKQIVIVIPIVTSSIKDDELVSLRQCLHILGNRDIVYLCSEKLDTSFYENINDEFGVPFAKQTFEPDCFSNVAAYNKLCFDLRLYRAFGNYQFLLLYQLDAFVFEDRLDYWCGRN